MIVALVGAGPGDPDLMTLRATDLLARAAVVIADASVLHLANRFAPRAVRVAVPDDEPAVELLLSRARGPELLLVRLYTGDPWLHPAHALELAGLNGAGIANEAVAGVAVELAVPALSGISAHVRHLAVTCTIGPADEMPPAVDPARTLLVVSHNGAAAASRLASTGESSIPAAIVRLDLATPAEAGGPGFDAADVAVCAGGPAAAGWAGGADPADAGQLGGVVRGTLAEVGRIAGPTGPSILVVGAVAGPVTPGERRHSGPDRTRGRSR